MAFARTTAVAGVGTVSCTGTTTVTGAGTSFAFGFGGVPSGTQARVGGTITVAGVTKTIVAIQSATSLTTDTAFGTFTGSAFTVQTGIIQSGTDTLSLSVGSVVGMTITNRADLYRTFDCQGNDLWVDGVLTVLSSVAQLRNDGSCNNRLTVTGSVNGGELVFNGRISTAGNGPIPYAGLDWLGTNGMGGATALNSTNSLYPAKLTLIDACIRFGADWFTVSANNFARITTQGDECWILCAKGTGTTQARLRLNNNTPVINFQAKQTWVGVWPNFGSPQISLKGFTPIFTDGPEINVDTISVVSRITLEDYNTSYIQAAYYAGSQIVLYGGAWTRIKNNLLGSNIVWRSVNGVVGRYNIIELSKQVKATAKDAAGNLLSDGYFYFTPRGSNIANIRPKGVTTDVTFDLSKQTLLLTSGSAETEFVYAWDFSIQSTNESTYEYFCSGQTKGAETHPAAVSRYGYDTQPITMTLSGNGTYEATTVHASLPTTDKVIANAAAITGVSINFAIKTITVTGSVSIQQIYDYYQYQRNLVVNLGIGDDCIITGNQTRYAGWNIQVNTTGTITSSAAFNSIYADTVNIINSASAPYLFNGSGVLQSAGILLTTTILGVQDTYTGAGSITAIYANLTGTSTTLELRGVTNGASAYVGNNATSATIFFESNSTTDTKTIYFPPGSAGLNVLVARELYGYQRVQEVIPLSAGLVWYQFVDIEDVGISVPTKATVAAYTTLNNPDKVYDYTAYKRLEEAYIKLGQITIRDGSSLLITPYSMKVDHNAASVYSIAGDVIKIKSSSYEIGTKYTKTVTAPPDTVTAHANEIITCPIEDANGDSQLTISGGDGNYELWKITTATPTDSYATGTLLSTVGTGIYRFIGSNGFDIVGRDTNSGIRRRTSMTKGSYEQKFYVGDQIQLAQQPQVLEILTNIEIMQVDIDSIKGTGFLASTDSLEAISTSLGAVSLATTNMPLNVWGYTTRTLTSEGASGATLAEIEGSLILAKKSQIDALGTPMQSSEYVAPDNVKINQIKTKVDSLQNTDLSTLPTLAQMEDSTILAKQFSVLEIGSPLQAADYVEPDNLSIGQIKAKTDTLENYDDTILIDKIDSISASVGELDTSDLAKETTAQAAKKAAKLAAALSA